ncbi:MAG: PAS domain S-box protein [candidate division KSB1 bacterium]|nr:PAS domain S-box protein [candidate division KSB1 bacterium]
MKALIGELLQRIITHFEFPDRQQNWIQLFTDRMTVVSAASIYVSDRVAKVGKNVILHMLIQESNPIEDQLNAFLELDRVFDEIDLAQLAQFLNLPPRFPQSPEAEQAKISEQLRSRLNLFYNAFQHSTDGIIITDLGGRILEANEAFLKIFGYEYNEVIGQHTGFLRAPQTSDEFYRKMWESINTKGEWKGEIINKCKDGSLIPVWLSITPIYEDGQRIGYMGVEIDISEKKRIENALIKEKRFTESLIETANSLIVGLNLKGEITLFNKKLEATTGYKKEEVLGKKWFEIFLPERIRPSVEEVFDGIVNNKIPSYYENPILTRSGEERYIAWSNTAIRNENNEIIGALGIGQDITEQKRLEQQILHSERLATIGQMAAKVAHEIRNPLSSIMLNAELLGDEIRMAGDAISEDAEVLLKSIISEVDRVAKLTEDYLQFSRLPDADPQPGDLINLIQEVVEFIEPEASSRGIQIVSEYETNALELVFDAQQMRQVLMNILKNALEAMRRGGILTVRVQDSRKKVLIAISDTGDGIPEKLQDKIFQPFYTTKDMGTGLGLAISQQVIQEHGGNIEFESEPGKGTTFYLHLPKKRFKK